MHAACHIKQAKTEKKSTANRYKNWNQPSARHLRYEHTVCVHHNVLFSIAMYIFVEFIKYFSTTTEINI